MMNLHRDIQQRHERAVVADFLAWFERRRKVAFRVIDEPDPPDAIIQSKRLIRWVEVVDAFWSKKWAIDQCSYATPGKEHVPQSSDPCFRELNRCLAPPEQDVPLSPTLHNEPDLSFAKEFVKVLSQKLEKASYQPFEKKYGPGYLIVNIDYPLFDRHSLLKAQNLWASRQPSPNRGYFREVLVRVHTSQGYMFRTLTWAMQRGN